MTNNLENDRSITTGKMYPIDLAAPQKITIVKSMSNTEVKMAHLISGQPKTTGASQIITHTGPVGLMRTAAQVVTGVASQPQMIVSGAPILQGTQIVSQGSQLMGQNSQIISQSQLIGPSGQILSPATQIISQGTQLTAQVSNSSSTGASNAQVSVASSVSAAQVLNVGGQLSVVSSAVRTLPPSVRVLPTLPHHNNRPVLSSVNVSSAGGVLVSKGMTSHVPRGLAAGASLAVRPVTPTPSQPALAQANNNAWTGSGRGRSALVYGGRAPMRAAAPRPAPAPAPPPHSAIVTLPTTTVLTSSGVISSSSPAPATPRPLPLLQRNYQPAKSHAQVVGVATVGVRGAVGNSAPPQLYYEVPRAPRPLTPYAHQPAHQPTHQPSHQPAHQPTHQPAHQPTHQPTHQPVLATSHVPSHQPVLQTSHQPSHQISHQPAHQQSVNIVSTVQTLSEHRLPTTPVSNAAVLPRPSILRKREVDGSPSKNTVNAIAAGLVSVGTNLTSTINVNNVGNVGVGSTVNLGGISINNIGIGAVNLGSGVALGSGVTLNTVQGCAAQCGWEESGGGGGGSTTESAASSPDEEAEPPPHDREPRKKPRKQMLSSEVRHCEFPSEDAPPTPPPVTVNPLPKRPLLSSSYVCGWRGTALHFTRPADVRRREPRARDIVAIASQKHVLTSAEGWKVHHLTAQMDDLVLLEADVGDQLEGVLRAIESASGRALAAIQPHSHAVLELIKGNIQRSKIVCEGIQEAREDILRVFKHRNFVSDILTRQADKRCFRKHRSQS